MAGEPTWFSGTPSRLSIDVGNLRCLLRYPSKSPEQFHLHSTSFSSTHPASKIHTCYVTPLCTLAYPSNSSNKHMIEQVSAQYLLDKFRGRRRCLVSCVEHLMKTANREWSKIEVDNFYNRLTNFTEKFNMTSLYHQVHTVFITSKGLFEMGGLRFNAAGLLRRMGTYIVFVRRPAFSISSKNDMTLLECSLGRIERVIDEDKHEYVIEEPMVLAALFNYLERNNEFESSLKELMASSRDDISSLGLGRL